MIGRAKLTMTSSRAGDNLPKRRLLHFCEGNVVTMMERGRRFAFFEIVGRSAQQMVMGSLWIPWKNLLTR